MKIGFPRKCGDEIGEARIMKGHKILSIMLLCMAFMTGPVYPQPDMTNGNDITWPKDGDFDWMYFGDLWRESESDSSLAPLTLISDKLSIDEQILSDIKSKVIKVGFTYSDDSSTATWRGQYLPSKPILFSAYVFPDNPDFILLRFNRTPYNIFVGYFRSSKKSYILENVYSKSLLQSLNNMITENKDDFYIPPIRLTYTLIGLYQTQGPACFIETADEFMLATAGLRGKWNPFTIDYWTLLDKMTKDEYNLFFADLSQNPYVLDSYELYLQNRINKDTVKLKETVTKIRDKYFVKYGTNIDTLNNHTFKIQTTCFNPVTKKMARWEVIIDSNGLIESANIIKEPYFYKELTPLITL